MDGFIDEVITPTIATSYTKDISNKSHFMPWHKPRKQWCRFHQWIKGFNQIIPKLAEKSESEFKYLGLPGNDLLDLRLIAHACKTKDIKLKYLGFNSIQDKSVQDDELKLSESELHKTGNVSTDSRVITEPLESLSRRDSSAFINAKSFKGFHMINFDLCNSFAISGPNFDGDTYFKALANIIENQIGEMKTDWLLFLTTHVSKQSVVKSAMEQLLKAVDDNITNHAIFEEKFVETLQIQKAELKGSINNTELLKDSEFMDLFALGISKWILKLCNNALKFWKIELLESCTYSTGYDGKSATSTPNMLSIGLKFSYSPPRVNDAYSLARSESVPNLDEVDLAIKMLDELDKIFNLDIRLSKNKSEFDELKKHSAELLSQARYDKDAYFRWVDSGYASSF